MPLTHTFILSSPGRAREHPLRQDFWQQDSPAQEIQTIIKDVFYSPFNPG
jgi:hypothetical protein